MSEPVHGKFSTYTNHRCRCEACTEANRLKVRAYYQQHLQRDRKKAEHGTESRYQRPNHCRCDLCREASRLGRARRRASLSPTASAES